MRNVEIIFNAITMLYKYDMYDYISEEDNKKIANILVGIIKRYNEEDKIDIEDDLRNSRPSVCVNKIDDDWN